MWIECQRDKASRSRHKRDVTTPKEIADKFPALSKKRAVTKIRWNTKLSTCTFFLGVQTARARRHTAKRL